MPDEPRLLHRDSSHGYTNKTFLALPDEPEAISAEDQQVISLRARTGFAAERKAMNDRRDRQMWQQRLRRVEMRAADRGVDLFKQQAQVRQAILDMERLVDDAATAA